MAPSSYTVIGGPLGRFARPGEETLVGPGRFSDALRWVLCIALCVAIAPVAAVGTVGPPADGSPAVPATPKAPPGSETDANGFPCVAGEVLVKFEPGVGISTAQSAHASLGVKNVTDVEQIDGLQLAKLPDGVSVAEATGRYRALPGVEYAQPNYLYHIDAVPSDPRFEELWGMDNTGQTGGAEEADIDAPEAWDVTTGDGDIIVAVIDTGVDYRHPDLVDNIWTNPSEVPGNGIDDDMNGYTDDVHGYDFVNYDGDPVDDHSHGTHCSGTIGASANNGIGVAGVAWDVQIMACKFLSADGWGDTMGAVEAIAYADQMGADIMSNSWGGGPYEEVLLDAIAGTDALFVAAAGNDSMDTDANANYPSCYDLPNVLAVGATDYFDDIAWFSNWGAETVDVFAPGEQILSTVAGPPPAFSADVMSSAGVSTCDDISDWDVSDYTTVAWDVSTQEYVSDPASLAHLGYDDDEDSWAYLNAPVDLSSYSGASLRFQGWYETEPEFDYLNVWASPDGSTWSQIGAYSGFSGGFVSLMNDLSAFVGDSDVYLAFSLSSDDSVSSKEGFLGAYVDDIEIVEIDPVFTDDFSDLSGWDASEYANTPWDLTTEYFVSAPSAAGVIGYDDNELSMLKLTAPLDLSGVTGDLALTANVLYETEPGLDVLQVLASTDGANWTPVAAYSGFSGWYGPAFVPVKVDLSEFAGASEVYLGFGFESDGTWSSGDGFVGVAVDDLSLLTGTWTEADYTDAYEYFGGTSMATPHVAGIAALVMSEWPGKDGASVRNAIIAGADYVPALDGLCVSNGRANALDSLQDLYGPDVTDDAVSSYLGRAEITLLAQDDTGVESISYAFDDDEPTTIDGDEAVAVSTLPAPLHTLTYWAEDTLGNVSEPVTVEFTLVRGAVSSVSVAGADRFATAVEASQRSFPDGTDSVVLATGRNWPDALGGTALAGALNAPILLTDTFETPGSVTQEIERLGAGVIYVLGGESAISDEVVEQLTELVGTGNVIRYSGENRYETARVIAEQVIALEAGDYDGTAFVATGANFPDALAAAPIARAKAWPVLLADPAGEIMVPDEVSRVIILGGTSAVSDGIEAALIGRLGEDEVARKGGTDRYATAALVSAWGVGRGMHWDGVGIATGSGFADALAGGAMLGSMRSVMLLTPGDTLASATRAPLSVNKEMIQTVHFVGGTSTVSSDVREQVMLVIE